MTIRWVTGFFDFPVLEFEAGRDFWAGVTGYALSPPRGPRGDFATLVPGRGDAYLRVQRTRDSPAGCHLDFHAADWTGLAERAGRLGARKTHAEEGLAVLRSPGGLAFCVSGEDGGMPLRLLLQRTGDPPGTEVRAHPDLACADAGAEVIRHEGLGATRSRDGDGWVTMRDPAGMAYCITRRDPAV